MMEYKDYLLDRIRELSIELKEYEDRYYIKAYTKYLEGVIYLFKNLDIKEIHPLRITIRDFNIIELEAIK